MKTTRRYTARLNEHDDVIQRDLLAIRHAVGDQSVVLDVGCGAGSFLSACTGQVAIGVDVSRDAVLFCRGSDLCVAVADARRLPFPCGSFDALRSKEVLEHIPEPLTMVIEMRRVLRSGGLFVCHVPTHFSMVYPLAANFFDDYTHIRPFSRQGIENLLGDGGFRVLRTEGYTSPRDWWQRPIAPILSIVLPHVWRVLATPNASDK